MDCPRCDGDLYPVRHAPSNAQHRSVHRCSNCQGTWFQAGELDRYLGNGHRAINAAVPEPAQEHLSDLRPARCPGCRIDMERRVSTHDMTVALDVCPHCDATWADSAALERLEAAAAEVAREAALFWGSKATG